MFAQRYTLDSNWSFQTNFDDFSKITTEINTRQETQTEMISLPSAPSLNIKFTFNGKSAEFQTSGRASIHIKKYSVNEQSARTVFLMIQYSKSISFYHLHIIKFLQ